MMKRNDDEKEEDRQSYQMRKLLDLYFGEEELNLCIQTTHDLSLLQTILKLKSSLIDENKHSPISFSIQNILKEIQVSNIDEICLVLRYALIVQPDESQYIELLNYISMHLKEVNNEDSLKSILKLLKIVLFLCDSSGREKTFKEFLIANNLNKTICKLLFDGSKIITNFISIYILPKYLKVDIINCCVVLEAIWKNILDSKSLDVLCAIPEFFLPIEASCGSYRLVENDEFWCILQENLNNSNSSIQKQALYLLKTAIFSIENKESFSTNSQTVFWNASCKAEVRLAWQNIIMLFEIVREKQLHLIEPSYQLLSTLQILHSSWLICIYKILLNHPHSRVSAYAVLDILKSNWYNDESVFKVVIRCLLSAMNKTEITENNDIWTEFYEFTNKLNNREFLILLEESTQIQILPPVCYQIYRNIFTQQRLVFISTEQMEQIFNNIQKLPHKFIRNGCIDLVVNFLSTSQSHERFSFDDYVTANWILYKHTDNLLYGSKLLLGKDFIKYRPHIESSIQNWNNSKTVNLKQARFILTIFESSLFESEWANQHIFQPLMQKKFTIEISDHLLILLSRKDMISMNMLCDYLEKRLINPTPADELIITNIVSQLSISKYNENELTNLIHKAVQILLNVDNSLVQLKLAFEIINIVVVDNEYNFAKCSDIDDILNYWKGNLLNGNKHSMHCCLSFVHLYCYKELNMRNSKLSSEKLLEIITIFETLIEAGNNNVVPIIFIKLKDLLNVCQHLEIVFSFIDLCLKKINELRRTDSFKSANNSFIQSIFTNSKILSNDRYVLEKTLNITWQLLELAKYSDDVAYNLGNHLYYMSTYNADVAASFIPIIVELLLFGDILKKDQRAEYVICQQIDIDKQQVIHSNNPNFQRISVRTNAIAVIKKVLLDDAISSEDRTRRADAVTLLLINKYTIHFNKRYFAHSHVHLQKLRILQALLIVHDYIDVQKQPLIDLLLNCLSFESHQISIKFFIQWLLIRLLHDNDKCLSIITSKMESTSKVHSSTIIAFVPILYHIALWRNDETFYINLFEVVLPWTMGAHFNLRLYAQEGIKKLYEVAVIKNFKKAQEKLKSTADCITQILKQTERKIDLIDRFVFDTFNAKDHFNLQMIYFYIPKITNVTYDEFENILSVRHFSISENVGMVSIENWTTVPQRPATKSAEHQSCTNVIQKKISPPTESIPRDVKIHKTGELVVVASLIDKTPNLGGLSRSCEIFGVKQLVISTISIIKDHEFQSVSMSSENWVNILEKKVDHLRSFLLDMKERGYSVVGAEQTSDSVELHTFQFPKKCILLLGNEKEGIPPNMLALIDFCVEIPQFGVVRSLNVHVAAATFIWEYTKQHVV